MSRLVTAAATGLAGTSLLLAGATGAVAAPEAPAELALVRPEAGTLAPVASPAPGMTAQSEGTLAAFAEPGDAGLLNATEAFRVIDTRLDGTGPVGPQETRWYDVSELGLPADTIALVLNVTATQGTAPTSFVSVLDGAAAEGVPTTSSVNASRGRDVANLVTVPLVDGAIGLYNDAGSTHLAADIQAIYRRPATWGAPSSGSGYVPVDPTRVLDTRGWRPLGPAGYLHLGIPGAPDGATAVAVTITSTETTAPTSYVGAWPYDISEPTRTPDSSVLNAYRGSDVPNLAVIPLGALGDNALITLYNDQGSTHLVVDVVGYFVEGSGSAYYPVPAHRAEQSGLIGPASEVDFTADRSLLAVPDDATAVALNLTTASPSHSTYLTAYPTGTVRPLASSTNARVGADVATAAITRTGPGFTVYNNAGSVLTLVDVQGYFAAPPVG